MQSVEAIANANAMGYTTVGSVLLFERFDFIPQNVPGGPHESVIGLVQLGF
jgi:hypothetical protein